MYPYLFDWVVNGHHLRPPTYGVLLAIGFTLGYVEALHRANKLGENVQHVENLFLFVVFGSMVGSRLFHVFFEEFDYYLHHPIKIFYVWEGGYTFYGAVLASILVIYLYTRRYRLNFLQFGDIAAISVAIGLFLGRIGCFAAGCCWGRPTTLPWGVTFKDPESFTNVHNVPLHPTQLYEAFAGLFIYLFLVWRFRHRKYQGQVFLEGLIAYAVARFIIEIFRGDDYRGFVFNGLLSYSQLVSLFILPFAIAGIFLYRNAPQTPPSE
jgi:phosphatidylglycerol---prolipoprotein diacylglyceryl transferase